MSGTGRTYKFSAAFANSNDANTTLTVLGAGNTLEFGSTLAISPAATSRTLTINGTGNVTVDGGVVDGGTATASPLVYSGLGTLKLLAQTPIAEQRQYGAARCLPIMPTTLTASTI